MSRSSIRGLLLWLGVVALSPIAIAVHEGEFTWRVVAAVAAALLVVLITLMLVEPPRSLSATAWLAQLHARFVPRSLPPSNSTEEAE